MNKTIIKYIIITIVFIIIAIVIKSCFNSITKKMLSYDDTTEEIIIINETEYIPKVADDGNTNLTITDILQKNNDGKWDKYPLSGNFRNKFKNRFDIINEVDNAKIITGGKNKDKDNRNAEKIILIWKDNYRNDNCFQTNYYFEYKINDKHELDDLILLRKVDYREDGERLDGKKEVNMDNIGGDIYMYLFPWDFIDYVHSNDILDNKTISKNCVILNAPKKGCPIESDVWDYYDNIVYMKFKYEDGYVYWKVNYHINEDYQFDKIEFIQINENELPEKVVEHYNRNPF